jgi:SAM-dependent methyltransferase
MDRECNSHVFNRSGLAPVSDLQTHEWRQTFEFMEKEQETFLKEEHYFRSPEYKWPRDPLHTWSRIWEYPYVYHHLNALRGHSTPNALPRVVDFGSGVTFLPFSLAHMGYHVICIDADPVCGRDMGHAIEHVPQSPGKVEFRQTDGTTIPLPDGEVSALYSISVLEHIPAFENTIREMARVLTPCGLLLLTVDIDLGGESQIGIDEFRLMKRVLSKYFEYQYPETTIHPLDVLNSRVGPYRESGPQGLHFFQSLLKNYIAKPLLGKKPRHWVPFLAVNGFVLKRTYDVVT